jgi:di/tricarboxylate transporter
MNDQDSCSLIRAGWRWDGEKLVHPRHKAAYRIQLSYVDEATAQKLSDRLEQDVREARRLNIIGNIIEIFMVAAKVLALLGIPTMLVFAAYLVATRVFENTSWHVAVLFGSFVVVAVVLVSLVDDNMNIRWPNRRGEAPPRRPNTWLR